MLELYHNDMSTCAQKVRATLAEKDLAWDGQDLNLRTGEQHKPQFLKLNPRGVVPVLVHDGNVIVESNIIMEYVEDAFPDTKRLMPKSALEKAAVRNSLQRLDTALHLHIATISIGIAFRDQLLAVLRTIKHSSCITRRCPILAFRPCTAMSCRPAPARNPSCWR